MDASTMEANAALRNIVRRDTGEGCPGTAHHRAALTVQNGLLHISHGVRHALVGYCHVN